MHVVGLSILSGSHVPLVHDVVARMRAAGLDDVPVVVGGIIPPDDARTLKSCGVAAVYTPKDYELNRIMADVVRIVERGEHRRRVTFVVSRVLRAPRRTTGCIAT